MKIENMLQKIKELKLSGKNVSAVASRLASVYDISRDKVFAYFQDMEDDGEIYVDQKDKLFVVGFGGLEKGVLNGNSKGFCFCILDDTTKDDVFIASPNLNGAMHSDKVLVKTQKNKTDGRTEGIVEKILERGI